MKRLVRSRQRQQHSTLNTAQQRQQQQVDGDSR
jgi:hypothetical protein